MKYEVIILATFPVKDKNAVRPLCVLVQNGGAQVKLFITSIHGHHVLKFILNLHTFDSETLSPSCEGESMGPLCANACVCVCVRARSTNISSRRAVKVVMR